MIRSRPLFLLAALLLAASFLAAQQPEPPEKPAAPAPATNEPERLALPTGTRLALILVNTVNTVATTTTAGAGVGAIAAGAKGTAIGAAAGAAAGLAAVLLTRGKELELPRGTTLDVILDRPLDLDPTLVQFEWTRQGTSLPGPSSQQNNRGLPYPRRPF